MNLNKVNPYFQKLDVDYLYHLGIDSSMDIKNIFADVKYVVMTRQDEDVTLFASEFGKQWYGVKEEFSFQPLFKTERFHLYKVGPLLAVSHGVGSPSMLICLNEIVKLLVHLKCSNVTFFKVGPAGGIGDAAGVGSLIAIESALNGKLEPIMHSIECGEEFAYPTTLDSKFLNEVIEFSQKHSATKLVLGNSIGASDFYEEQARINGFLTLSTTKEDRDSFLAKAENVGVKSINMEVVAFSGFCRQLDIQACAIDAIVVERNRGDEVRISYLEQQEILAKAFKLITEFILFKLKHSSDMRGVE